MHDTKASLSIPSLRSTLVAFAGSLGRHHGRFTIAAILAAAAVIITAAAGDPVFRSEAVVTTLFDDDAVGGLVGVDLSGTSQGVSPGLNLLISRPRGQIFPLILGSRTVAK
ncbi:MAG: hypothetical protein GY778_22070, partial [bacterium]|nr:hypothetical protein [bacterium]